MNFIRNTRSTLRCTNILGKNSFQNLSSKTAHENEILVKEDSTEPNLPPRTLSGSAPVLQQDFLQQVLNFPSYTTRVHFPRRALYSPRSSSEKQVINIALLLIPLTYCSCLPLSSSTPLRVLLYWWSEKLLDPIGDGAVVVRHWRGVVRSHDLPLHVVTILL